MPEGPEVAVFTIQLDKLLKGVILRDIKVTGGPHKKFSEVISKELKPLLNKKNQHIRINNVRCKGKFIYFELVLYKLVISESDPEGKYLPKAVRFIGNHLGMTGHWRKDQGKHNMVTLIYTPYDYYLEVQKGKKPDQLHMIYFDDMRHFAKFLWLKVDELKEKLKDLGPDVLSDKFTEAVFKKIMNQKKVKNKMIGNILMDQHILSGIGNYLRADILYASQIHPRSKVNDLTDDQLKALYTSIKEISGKAYEQSGTTIRTYKDINMEVGHYDPLIYGKNTDPLGNPVETFTMSARTCHFVPAVQKL